MKFEAAPCASIRVLGPLLIAAAGMAAVASPAVAQPRAFQRSFAANLPGQLIVTGNSVVTCDRSVTGAGICNAVENGGPPGNLSNDVVPTAWIDADGVTGDRDGNGTDDTFNSSRATIPFAGTVEWAGLYWWGSVDADGASSMVPLAGRDQVLLKGPMGAYAAVQAAWRVGSDDPYLAFADVTTQLQAGGSGEYTVANVVTFPGADDKLGGWALVVVNRDSSLPLRHVSVFDGYQSYGGAAGAVSATFQGFLTPLIGPLDAQVTFIALDGDAGKSDSVTFQGNVLSNAVNPADEFGNSTISRVGTLVAGRTPAYANTLGTDIDTYDVSALLANGDTSATSEFSAVAGETNFAVVSAFQTTLYAPEIVVTLSVEDVNGGAAVPGDELRYTATVTNKATARDGAVNVSLMDAIPASTAYIPGSLALVSSPVGGPTAGALTDAPGDDSGSVGAGVTTNLGVGASAATGGTLAPGQTAVISFSVRIDPNLLDQTVISNQATVTFEGQTLASSASSVTFRVTSSTPTGDGPVLTPVDAKDSDGDGLPDKDETRLGSNPNDADTDDDGVIDGSEPQLDKDVDGDGAIGVLDPDSDDDGLFDGTELGLPCTLPATNVAAGRCVPDADAGATKTDPTKRDTDAGTVSDGAEDSNRNGRIDAGETNPNDPADDVMVKDSDGDGLSDDQEKTLGSNPNDADTDDDGVRDGREPNLAIDTDGDGLINVLDPDSDDDGLFDGTELGLPCNDPATNAALGRCVPDADAGATKTNPLARDTDAGTKLDGAEDANRNGRIDAGETNPNDPADDVTVKDADMDGLSDDQEKTLGSDPKDADTDDDGLIDGQEPNPGDDGDRDGVTNVLDPDSDDDGLSDGTEAGKGCDDPATNKARARCVADADMGTTRTSVVARDTDRGSVSDGAEDSNRNGRIDAGERNPNDPNDDVMVTDTDRDGLSDDQEGTIGSDPKDADTDDDGLLDGQEPDPAVDDDGDGLVNVLDPDSDDDGLFDGTEAGKTCDDPATSKTRGRCIPDADAGTTRTSVVVRDTDRGTVSDGAEDSNRNGRIDAGERNPNDPTDDLMVKDTDKDGLSDDQEGTLGSDPNDADTDDDGLLDGLEPNPGDDADGDGKKNVLDPDSDDDGLFDGTEAGKTCQDPATNKALARCVADADLGATRTSPVVRDTDRGGVSDGAEDANLNGRIDPGETNPNDPSDDVMVKDTDRDGLSDGEEGTLGSDPNDADTDDDGVIDGQEPDPAVDSDGDGKKNVLDPDSDNDGLFDGTELGKACDNKDTRASAVTCKPDADAGATRTSPVDPDTDDGGVSDGTEDKNRDGAIQAGEGDPNDPRDDAAVKVDTDADGLSDDMEGVVGSKPNDADTDDDGVIDGQEPHPGVDADGDGRVNVLDADSDNDGLFDGTELGSGCDAPATNRAAGTCVADADRGATTTNPERPDTDAGGVADGIEDTNRDGAIQSGERNPNDPADDQPVVTPDPGQPGFVDGRIGGGGCDCSVGLGRGDDGGATAVGWFAGLALLGLVLRKRR